MKNAICLLSLLLFSATAFSQQIALKKEYPDATFLKEAIPIEDGYLVAGYRSRVEKKGYLQTRYYRPFVARLDARMKTRWEKKFPESKHWPIRAIVAANGGFYAIGHSNSPKANEGTTATLLKLSPEGRLVFEKHYRYTGYHSGEGADLEVLPNGDLLARVDLFRKENSIEEPRLLRLSPRGEKIREFGILGSHYRYYPQRYSIDHEGRLVLVGFAYRNETDFKQGKSRGWIRVIDLKTGAGTIAERFYDEFNNLEFNDAIELATGGYWILGNAHDDKYGYRRYAVLLELDETGEVIRKRRYEHEHQLSLDAFCWSPEREQLVMVGRMMQKHTSPRSAMYTVDHNWDLKKDVIGDKGFYHQVTAFSGGELFVVKQKGVMVMK